MIAFLYIHLLSDDQTVAYGTPLLDQVKKQFPDMAVLDVDSQSGELVLHYARQMLQEASKVIVCINSTTPDAGFGSIFPLLELLLANPNEQLILFRNEHIRLQRLVQARPELKAEIVQTEEEVLDQVRRFLV
ncbi:hypothetical protein WG947_12290 [Pontibacter sp. H259]|uniref:hypothetical protein n=1 Tax=Pontibacter sp. H259 TaxID=3133421 RepID=UPI0030BD4FBF